mgnify:FL=1
MYEKIYHAKVHKNLLESEEYYLFRAKCADKFYWKYLNGDVLEFGCGLGQNIFLHRGNSLGIEISEFALNECKKKNINVQKDIKKIKSGYFDGILCVHVLEHLKNPYETIEEFYRVLKKNGIIVLVLPCSKNYKPVKNFKSDVARHIYNWNFSSINELLNDLGFKIKLNKFNYAYGYSKLYTLQFKVSMFALNLFGRLKNQKEMIIVAEK